MAERRVQGPPPPERQVQVLVHRPLFHRRAGLDAGEQLRLVRFRRQGDQWLDAEVCDGQAEVEQGRAARDDSLTWLLVPLVAGGRGVSQQLDRTGSAAQPPMPPGERRRRLVSGCGELGHRLNEHRSLEEAS
jgi:hypothetical protein